MREIKFRAWKPETKKMFHDFDQNIKEVPLGKSIHLFVYETGLHYKTLMQYTGLKDKNGKEIYEGDVLQTRSGIGYMVFDNCGYAIKSPGSEAVDYEFSAFYLECEIIGNMYENPELLNQ